MAESVDAADLKSAGLRGRVGSSPTPGTSTIEAGPADRQGHKRNAVDVADADTKLIAGMRQEDDDEAMGSTR